MSTVPIPIRFSKPLAKCEGCGQSFMTILPDPPALCGDCRKSLVYRDAAQAVSDVQAIRCGDEPFNVLSVDERAELLEDLNILPAEREFTELPGMNDSQLIAALGLADDAGDPLELGPRRGAYVGACASEIARRIAERNKQPAPAEREEIEQRIEAMDAERFDEAFAGGCC